ncbi:MAG: MurR/RpiR family transcriptional regulator [Firmicutes bacterium]|nr:MurR/RpiR family transcriptional regulator [Bacillota bacterium]MCL1953796.1 MurR/RpiR family transcriptional regulator [Bacillota bacterium]
MSVLIGNLSNLINRQYLHLNENERQICHFILANKQEVASNNISCLSQRCHCSNSTVHRLLKKLGFSGFSEFKFSLKLELEQNTCEDEISSANLIEWQLQDIVATQKLCLQSDIKSIVLKMFEAKNIYGYGTGSGQHNALRELNRSLMSIGKYINIIPAKKEFDLVMPSMSSQDFIIIISLSGETEGLKPNIITLSQYKIPILSITHFNDNFLARNSSYNLYYQATVLSKTKDRDLISMLSLSVVCDMLYREFINYLRLFEV